MTDRIEIIEKKLEEIMDLLEIERTESNKDTPYRIAKMWVNEIFINRNDNNLDLLKSKMKVFENVDSINDLIIIKDIDFHTYCEHHWLPFFGKVAVGYVPDKYIIGLSKVPRVVEYFSKRPQLQERFVKDIAVFLNEVIKPKCIFVVAEAVHTCVLCRGIEAGSNTNTVYKIINDKNLSDLS